MTNNITKLKEGDTFIRISKYGDLFEDFTTLKWIKWVKRKPTHNGSILIRFNGKNVGFGLVLHGELRKLEGLANSEFKNYEDTFYWQEEIIDVEKFSEYKETT